MDQLIGRAVVTGGAGFIGSHLVDHLLGHGATEVVVFDNLTRGRVENLEHHRRDSRLRFVEGDVRDREALESVMRGTDIAFHLAAQSSVAAATANDDYAFATNVVGTFNLLRAAANQRVSRVVFASAREVYGEPISLPVDEDAPLLARDFYGATKLAGEALCRAVRREHGLSTVVLRFASVYGPRDTGPGIPLWIHQAYSGRGIDVYGGKQVIDVVWVGKAVEALAQAATLDGSFPPINIGSGTGTHIIDLARRIARLTASHVQVRLHPARDLEVTRFVARVDRMRQLLRVEPALDPLAYLPRLVAGVSTRIAIAS
jgi:UDP-glucose 4-epimerase